MNLATRHIEALGRDVWYRPGTQDETTIDEVFRHGYHLPPFADRQPAPLTVVDAGANIGLTMAHYRHLWRNAQIVGVELDPVNATIAMLNTQDPIVTAALSVTDIGIATYNPNDDVNSYTTHHPGTRLAARVTITDLLEQFHDHLIDFLKLDIEGDEAELLQDIDPVDVHSLLVEPHHPYTQKMAGNELKAAGYEITYNVTHPKGVYAWKP